MPTQIIGPPFKTAEYSIVHTSQIVFTFVHRGDTWLIPHSGYNKNAAVEVHISLGPSGFISFWDIFLAVGLQDKTVTF